MRPDDERCWQATQERDARLDGAFVVGVRTTGIYCRPSCPARALRRNMTFLDSPAAARRMGLRACRRCHPDEVAREWVRRDLKPVAPFDGERLREFLGRRAVPGIEEVDGDVYRRSLALPGGEAIAELDLGEDRAVARVRLADAGDLRGGAAPAPLAHRGGLRPRPDGRRARSAGRGRPRAAGSRHRRPLRARDPRRPRPAGERRRRPHARGTTRPGPRQAPAPAGGRRHAPLPDAARARPPRPGGPRHAARPRTGARRTRALRRARRTARSC